MLKKLENRWTDSTILSEIVALLVDAHTNNKQNTFCLLKL